MLKITGADLYTPRQVFPAGTLVCEHGRIVHAGVEMPPDLPPATPTLHLPGRRLLPGLIDLHTHGLLGRDAFGAKLAEVIQLLPRYGVTSFLATTVTLPMEQVLKRLRAMAAVLQEPPAGASCLGIHIEGNFLSPRRSGMARSEWCQPLTVEIFETLQQAAGGWIRMLTFAPEEGQAVEMIPYLRARGVLPSLGHSDATYEQAVQAIQLGMLHATHTFNAMSPLHQRAPGVVGAVLTSPRLIAELIADGIHVHPGAIRLLLQAKGVDGVCLVSDSSPVAGMPDGVYPWEGYTLVVRDGSCRLPDGGLAGAHALLDAGLRSLIHAIGLSPGEAGICTSQVPAGCLDLQDRKGSLLPGWDADVVIFDEHWQVETTLVAGETVYQRAG